ncbi:BON domain-containing protein [Saccharothrix syringae]|uniref:BON domain-containing protein n=1 Tax=Saccharothrix syringae TaxID=103733 RepID=A0A5Q0GVG5_SACSY|nr:BON domain-containing protein [Saccharothrix syringae]QFZ18067.1 BON domain-containing protein [Saccharothrix syringae]
MTAEPEQYLSARLRRALAEDPRTTEQGVRVTVRGDHVLLSGSVATAERRSALEAVIHDVAPGLTVLDDVKVVSVDAPAGREEL